MCVPDASRAAALLEQAVAIWEEVKNPLGEARAELALGRLSPRPEARTLAERAERRLRSLGIRPQAAAGAAGLLAVLPQEDRPPVALRTLGGFRVLREGQPVPASDWQSKKARDLLKILIARRGRPTPRDFLMETLWPEERPERLPKRLSVVLATLRAVLDPDRSFPSEHFVGGDDEAVWLDREHVPVDVESFLADAAAGLGMLRAGRSEEAREVLAGAETSYTGDFLEEDPYEEWTASLREEARANYIAVARALAGAAAEAGDHDAAVRYFLRILERDAFDEEAHLGLVSTFASAGRHGEARRSYRAYVARMEELDVEPAAYPSALAVAAV
jgi:DNA-binding SARP family transcriptional activator